MASFDPDALRRDAHERLAALADPEAAVAMAAYMKTTQPFYGVKKPERKPILRALREAWPAPDLGAWDRGARALWTGPERELRYLAVEWAEAQKKLWLRGENPVPTVVALVETCVVEGAWWDLIDHAVMRLLAPLHLRHRAAVRPTVEAWIDHPNMWLRRAALISQLKHRKDTDEEQLFRFCHARAHETVFWIRKAIGWALREYSYAAPEAVRDFLLAERAQLSGLSFREGAKQLVRAGHLNMDGSLP